jgi:DNA-binding XRE family transcriptional regulator
MTLYKIRHQEKLTQETAAERLGFHKGSIRDIEHKLGWSRAVPTTAIEAKEQIFAFLSRRP